METCILHKIKEIFCTDEDEVQDSIYINDDVLYFEPFLFIVQEEN